MVRQAHHERLVGDARMRRGLPRSVEWLLRVGLPADLREPIAGDLEEAYRRRVAREGVARATFDVWWQAFRVAVTFRWERAARGRPLPPIADEIPRRLTLVESLMQDVAYGLRLLRRQPGFTAVTVLMLALGIGANTAILGVVDAVLWRPLPYPHAERIMAVAEQRPREGRLYGPVAPADYFDWRRDARSFAVLAAYDETAVNLTGVGEPERLRGLSVSPGFLAALGLSAALGRDFRAEEETFGRHRVVLVTDALWRRRFGADPALVGRSITFDGNPYEVVGILPQAFWWRTQPDVLVPLALTDYDRALRAAHFLDIVGRLRSDASEDEARGELDVIGARLSAAFPTENRFHGPSVRPLRDALVGDVRVALLVLVAAVGFVLLIACANVATLLLARASSRHKELAVRRAVGATRGRIVQQMLTESLVVSAIGGAAGMLVAAWSLSALRAVLPAQFAGLPGIAEAAIDQRVLLTALGVTGATGFLFGVIPAVVASDPRVGAALGEESRGGSGSARASRLRSALVVSELALSLVLLAGAVLLIVSFNNLTDVQPGFRPERVMTVSLTLPGSRYSQHARIVAFYDGVFERLRAMPQIEHVAVTTSPPFSGLDPRLNLEFENRTVESSLPVRAHPRLASPDYFATMGIRLVRGRAFTDFDDASAPNVAIINEAAARRYWQGENPIGSRISLGASDDWREVIGVVGDIKHQGLDVDAEPEVFMPHRQTFTALGAGLARGMTLVLRTSADAGAVAHVVRAAVNGVDPQQPLGAIRSMEGLIAESIAPRRLNLLLISAFACIALVLTASGLYGVMAYLVAQRTREIGVRIALGATPRQVVGLVLRQAGGLTVLGIAIGVGGSLMLTQAMTSMLFGVSAANPAIYVGVSLLLAVVALLAAAVPSSRATRVDPIAALRQG
jgi:putative ABC transport system permease protein